MIKAKVILAAAFLLAFAAGAVLGVFLTRSRQSPPQRSWLANELGLSADQREQMRKIWAARGATLRQQSEKRQALTTQRDRDIQAVFSEEQRTRYDAIQRDYSQKLADLSQERRKASEDSDAQIRKILTTEQIAKYDELMKRQRERGPGGGMRGQRHGHRGPTSRPAGDEATTQPAGP